MRRISPSEVTKGMTLIEKGKEIKVTSVEMCRTGWRGVGKTHLNSGCYDNIAEVVVK